MASSRFVTSRIGWLLKLCWNSVTAASVKFLYSLYCGVSVSFSLLVSMITILWSDRYGLGSGGHVSLIVDLVAMRSRVWPS